MVGGAGHAVARSAQTSQPPRAAVPGCSCVSQPWKETSPRQSITVGGAGARPEPDGLWRRQRGARAAAGAGNSRHAGQLQHAGQPALPPPASPASVVAAGTNNGGKPVGEHCLVSGRMNVRTSPVDGQTYAIGFEMRLPRATGAAATCTRATAAPTARCPPPTAATPSAAAGCCNGLQMGFASSAPTPATAARRTRCSASTRRRAGLRLQGRGHAHAMARRWSRRPTGGPDRAYIASTSNGGRHTMVAAALRRPVRRLHGRSPGFNLPKAAMARSCRCAAVEQRWPPAPHGAELRPRVGAATDRAPGRRERDPGEVRRARRPGRWPGAGPSLPRLRRGA